MLQHSLRGLDDKKCHRCWRIGGEGVCDENDRKIADCYE